MNNPRTMPLMIVVIFIAIVLSCTIYFGITALIHSPDSYVAAPYREDAPLPQELIPFDRGFYLDASLNTWLTAADYRLFGRLADRSILVGKDEFLFPLIAETENGVYDYLQDYAGNASFDEETLDRLAKSLAKRSIAYANQDTAYLLAVIPSVQTIYRENLPWRLGEIGGETRLTQLKRYLTEHSDVAFLDLTDCLLDAKTQGLVYNNTEDSLNAYGAYAVYRAVLNALPGELTAKVTPQDDTAINIFTRYTAGKALARSAGVEDLIKNRTLSLSNETVLKYQVLERIAGMEVTYVKTPYKDEIPNRPAVLLEFSEDWDKILLMPYFSNTFGVAAYKTNPAYSQMAVDYLSPAAVVQFIHESELEQLLDETIMLSYNDGLEPGDDPFSAMTPIVLGTAQNGADRICIVGRCEEGSTIHLTGDGVRETVVETQGERFILEAVFDEGVRTAAVTLTAQAADKQDSAPEALRLTLNAGESARSVSVGSNSMLFRADSANLAYAGVYTRQQLRRVSTHFVDEAAAVAALTGKTTQMVYAYLPDKLDVYPEALGENALYNTNIPRVAQLSDALRSYNRISMIDLTIPLRTARSAGLQYRQTDSGLTPLGAFTAYRAMMATLAENDPRMTPRHRSDYVQSIEIRPGGDLVEALGLDGASITERVTVLTPTQTNLTVTDADGDALTDAREACIYTQRDESLPVAVVLRDAYGTQLLPYLAEHFSYVYVMAEGDLTCSDTLLQEIRPDYVFHLTSEYHLPLN